MVATQNCGREALENEYTPLIATLRRQRKVNFCEFEASLVNIVYFNTARAM